MLVWEISNAIALWVNCLVQATQMKWPRHSPLVHDQMKWPRGSPLFYDKESTKSLGDKPSFVVGNFHFSHHQLVAVADDFG